MLRLIFLIVPLLLVACNKVEKIPVPSPHSMEIVTPKRTYEEQKADAVKDIAAQKNAIIKNDQRVDLSSLSGRKLADLYAKYLGMPPGPVPPYVDVSFEERMATMYNQKVQFKRCKKKNPTICIVASDTVLSQAPEMLKIYLASDKMKMSLKEYIAIADAKVILAKKSIDWNALCKSRLYKLDLMKCNLLQDIMKNINGKDLVAYGMTELLATSDGQLNVKYLDVLLRNAGSRFLYFVPALGDRYASLGFYQFTFFALRDDDEKVEGASVVNAYVKDGGEKVPGSVVKLVGHEHHTAAFYFAVHNVATFLNGAKKQQVETLARIHQSHQDEMVILIACAHHAPGYTFPTVKKWLNLMAKPVGKQAQGKETKNPSIDIIPMFPKKADMKMYAQKSRNNLIAIYKL